MRRLAILLCCLIVTTVAWAQQDLCSGYQQSPGSPHKGPRKFNAIQVWPTPFLQGHKCLLHPVRVPDSLHSRGRGRLCHTSVAEGMG
jgi:hypothetical protein